MKDTTSAGHLYSSTIAPEAFTAWKGSAEPVYTVASVLEAILYAFVRRFSSSMRSDRNPPYCQVGFYLTVTVTVGR
jgi:hypothetical protein